MKKITSENWLSADPTMEVFAGYDAAEPMAFGGRLVTDSELATLSPKVPADIVRLYEMARAAVCYGYLFYPLYTLGFEQLSRCADSAMKLRLEQVDAKASGESFEKRIEWAAQNGIIETASVNLWHSIRRLRNEGSHSDGRTILPPSWAIGHLDTTVELINSLYDPSAVRPRQKVEAITIEEMEAAFDYNRPE